MFNFLDINIEYIYLNAILFDAAAIYYRKNRIIQINVLSIRKFADLVGDMLKKPEWTIENFTDANVSIIAHWVGTFIHELAHILEDQSCDSTYHLDFYRSMWKLANGDGKEVPGAFVIIDQEKHVLQILIDACRPSSIASQLSLFPEHTNDDYDEQREEQIQTRNTFSLQSNAEIID